MAKPSPKRLLIANRGEIAYRILRTAKRLGYFVISLYTELDVSSPHVMEADQGCLVSSYLNVNEIVDMIRQHRVDLVIPGYGFLSENEAFVAAVRTAGAVFVGPDPEHIAAFGIKHCARDLASKSGVPTCPGSDIVASENEAVTEAARIGYPVMLKATAGGGGMGLQICHDEQQVRSSFATVVSRGSTLFSNPGVFLERYYAVSRHIEIQVFGNGRGDCVVLGERECSIQRRHQKIIEESPSPYVESRPELRQRLFEVSEQLGRAVKYASAGTIEYLVDDATGDFFFLEMNTRLQVEHGITECRFDIDLVEMMLRQAESGALDLTPYKSIKPHGSAIEARVYAENPLKNFMPSPGVLQHVEFGSGEGVRVDTWVARGTNVSLAYDPLLAKVIGFAPNREASTAVILGALRKTKLQGLITNLDLLMKVFKSDAFARGRTTTGFLDGFDLVPQALEVLEPGSYTTIQDWPSRIGVGYGIPEGGPMDALHARLANCIVGNDDGCELLEITYTGPRLRFHRRCVFALTGAFAPDMTLDGELVPMNRSIEAPAGSVLAVGRLSGSCRAYIAFHGGFPGIHPYLGSKGTSPVVDIGGICGKPLVSGDLLETCDAGTFVPFTLPQELVPTWDPTTVYCMSGPHDSPDIIAPEGLEAIYSSEWTVSHQASRVGVRLHGPHIKWARETGGEGGSHPSNYLDYPYVVGGLNWTGDTSVLFPADAPSLGGYISSSVVPRAELYKLGQLRPGDKFHFKPISLEAAIELQTRQDVFLCGVAELVRAGFSAEPVKPLSLAIELELTADAPTTSLSSAILETFDDVTIRQAGDTNILIEFKQSLELDTRCRVQSCIEAVDEARIRGVRLTTPMGCSFLINYSYSEVSQKDLTHQVRDILTVKLSTQSSQSRRLKSRVVRLPLVFDDEVNKASIERYIATQRKTASYLPDPIEFIARANGLSSKQEVLQKLLNTCILVLGVGFFSGTPVGVPLDPRSRLSVPKFNPPRTFSPEGGVGFGGTFLSCDPIDAPGGYVNFGRTLPGWDKFCRNKTFGSRPWLFESFDQIVFYEVDEDELTSIFARFRAGKFDIDIEHTIFDVDEYTKFCESVATETEEFNKAQKIAMEREIQREKDLFSQWQEEQAVERDLLPEFDIDDSLVIKSETPASVYKICVEKGSKLTTGDDLLILEAMKMEIKVLVPKEHGGKTVQSIVVAPGDTISAGDTLVILNDS